MSKPANEMPTAAEYGQVRSFLAANGVSQTVINQYFPTGAHTTMTRTDMRNAAIEMCKGFKV